MTEITAFRTKTRSNPLFYVADVKPDTANRNPSSTPVSMSLSDPVSLETQPSVQSKRSFPWDYTANGKRPQTFEPEPQRYSPRKPKDIPGNVFDYPSNHQTNRPRPQTFEPELLKYSPRKPKDIPGNVCDYYPSNHRTNRQRPQTFEPELQRYSPRKPKDIPGNVFDYPSNHQTNRPPPREVRFSLDNPAFEEKEKPRYTQDQEDGHPITPKVVETEEQNYTKKKKKRRRSKYCVLIIIVIILLLLLLTMTGLFIWRLVCCSGKNDKLLATPTPLPATSPTGCKVNPNPIVFSTLPQRVLKELDSFSEFLEEGVKNNQSAAVSVNIVYGDKVIWEKGLGVLNKTEKPPRSPNSRTLYPCASVSKVLTAVVLFKLVNDARVRSLDDNVAKYEASFSVKNPFNNFQITLRELAAQRSGLKREAPCYPIPEGSTNLCPYDYNTMLNRIKNLSLLRRPGSRPQYSNLGYALLGRVLFHSFSSSGSDFDQWMKKEVFLKLNMMNTTFSPSSSQKLKMPVGYLDSTYVNPIYTWGWLQPTGGMFSTVDDLAKLLIELMTNKENDRFLSKSLTEELFKPDYIFPDSRTFTGTPWEMKQHDGYIIREKVGYIYGYNSYVAMVPELRLGINMLCTDCQQKLGSSIPQYFTKILSVFKEELVRASTKNFTLPPDPKPFLGQYNSTIPTLKRIDIKETLSHLVFAVNGFDLFFINSTGPGSLTFKISVNPIMDCMAVFSVGVENEIILFDKPSTKDGKSPGFFMYGASVDGRTYFTRVN